MNIDGITIIVYRYGFRPGFYAEATDASGKRLAFTGVYRGKGSRQKAIDAAMVEAKTGLAAADDRGCQQYPPRGSPAPHSGDRP